MIFPLTDEAKQRNHNRQQIARRCQAVDDLARTFADAVDPEALTELARTVKSLENSIEEHRENVRNTLAIQREIRAIARRDQAHRDPMGARSKEETL